MNRGPFRLPNTPDLAAFRDLHFRQGWHIVSIRLDVSKGQCSVELEKDELRRKIESHEPELMFTLASFKEGYDRDGRARFVRVKTDAYYEDMDSFIDEGNRNPQR